MDIPKVDTWFFEKLDFQYPNILSIKIVEGIKSDAKEYVLEDTDTPLGPYFPVRVEPQSRCLRVIFKDVFSFQVVDESLSSPQTELNELRMIGPVRECNEPEYQKYLESDSIIAQTRAGEYASYYLWTEDQTIFVVAASEPEIMQSDEHPNTELGRGHTYFSV